MKIDRSSASHHWHGGNIPNKKDFKMIANIWQKIDHLLNRFEEKMEIWAEKLFGEPA